MRSQEFTNKTVEEAIASGLNEMNLSLEEVTVDILEEGSKGFLGFIGTRMARVRLTEKPSSGQEDYESLIQSVKAPETVSHTKAPAKPAEGRRPESFRKNPQTKDPVREAPATKDNDAKPRSTRTPRTEMPQNTADMRTAKDDNPNIQRDARKPIRDRQAPQMEAQSAEKAFSQRPKKQFDRPAPFRPRERADQSPEVPAEMGMAGEFVIEMAKRMDLNIEIRATTKDKTLKLNIVGDDKGVLIGHRGETLDAIQYLASLVHNRDKEPYERIQLDSQNYRRKREDTLVQLANRLAEKARRTRHKVTLEPMNPYERRILHSALQNNPHVTTHSEGDEPNRRVVILPK